MLRGCAIPNAVSAMALLLGDSPYARNMILKIKLLIKIKLKINE